LTRAEESVHDWIGSFFVALKWRDLWVPRPEKPADCTEVTLYSGLEWYAQEGTGYRAAEGKRRCGGEEELEAMGVRP
jgi:hypothetical protein